MKLRTPLGKLALILSGITFAPILQAADYTWTSSGTASWASGNWSGSPAVNPATGPGASDNVILNASGTGVISLGGAREASTVTVNATTARTIQGAGTAGTVSSLDVDSITNQGSSLLQFRNGGGTMLLNITTGDLVLDGTSAASITLGATAATETGLNWLNSLTVTGETRIVQGTVNINIRNAENTSNSYTLGLLNLSGGTLNLNHSFATKNAEVAVSGLSGSGGTVSGATTAGAGGGNTGTSHLTITNATDYSSATVLTDGTSGGKLQITKSGIGTQTFTGTNTYTGGTTITSGRLQLGSGETSGSIVGNVATTNVGAEFAFNRSDSYAFDGVISGAGRVVQVGDGTTTLSAVNSYSGGTVVEGGMLQVGSDENLGDASGGVTLRNGAKLGFLAGTGSYNRAAQLGAGGGGFNVLSNSVITWAGDISGSGALTRTGSSSTSAVLHLTGNNSYTGGTIIEGGVVRVDGDHNLGDASGSVTFNNGSNTARLETQADLTSERAFILNGTTATLSASGSSTMRLNGTISGEGGINKTFSGTLVLAGDNTYSGGTTVTTGALLVANTEGSATGSGNVVVGADRILGGDGIIAPDADNHVTINGILRPGIENEGALRFNMSGASKLDFTTGSSIELTLGTESTLIAFLTTGDWLSGSGNAEINLTLGSGFSYEDSYTFIQGVSTADFGFAAVGGYDTNLYTHQISHVGDDYVLTFVAVPEPGALLLLGLAGPGALMIHCMRRKRAGSLRG